MKILYKIMITTALTVITANTVYAQSPDQIVETAISRGDAQQLEERMNSNVQLRIQGADNIYSKEQSRQILAKFFANNRVARFSVTHRTLRDGIESIDGTLFTNSGKYSVYLLLKNGDDTNSSTTYLIHQIRIENGND